MLRINQAILYGAPRLRSSPAAMALGLGLLFVSTSGTFIVLAQMDATAVVFWRMALAGLLFTGWAHATGALPNLRGEGRAIAWAAAALAVHFLLWVAAFDFTDFASNNLLLVAQPVLAACVDHMRGRSPPRRVWAAIALALVGMGLITGGDISLGPRALLGDLMCIGACVAMVFFYYGTTALRAKTTLAGFLGPVLLLGALFTLPVALLVGASLVQLPAASWGWLACIVLVTTVGGHGLMNYSARALPLFTVNAAILLEPVVSIAMGAAAFSARITPLEIGGGAMLSVAVLIAVWPSRPAYAQA